MEEKDAPTDALTETQICYGPSNNNTNSIKNKKTNSNNNGNQNQVKILKRESSTDQKKENNQDIQCMLCNQPHGRVYDLCRKKSVTLFQQKRLKSSI